MTKRGVFLGLCFLFLWTFFVCYPNPLDLGRSFYRIFNPPVDGIAAVSAFEDLPAYPVEIERFVLDSVAYSHDWEVYGRPWYFPSVEEALVAGRGDCKSRLIILASIFEYLDISYRVVFSPSHIWVDYEGKMPTAIENHEVAMVEEGRFLQIPKMNLERSKASFRVAFLDPIPLDKKLLFYQGILFSLFIIYRERGAVQ